jgi:putative FmdB family regulatory protein
MFLIALWTTEGTSNMPLYEYRCSQCHNVIEALQKAKEKPLEKCPKCGGRLVKLISPPAIQFKGSGWYVTDYSKKAPPPSEAKPETKAESGKDGQAASKPAAPAKD